MDWATRRVLAWRLSNTMDAGFCVAALEEALARFGKPDYEARRSAPLSALCRSRRFAPSDAEGQRIGMALPRKLCRRTPRRRAECPDNLHDYADPSPQWQAPPRADCGPIRVTDDWPEHVPIGDAERRVIEGHMRHELNKLFKPLP